MNECTITNQGLTMNVTEKHIEDAYFEWLRFQIGVPNNKSYSQLFERMNRKEFVWIVSNDDNRIEDAKELRREFLQGDPHTFQSWVSVLEILVAVSRRMEWTAGGIAKDWAWRLIQNLELHRMWDPLTMRKAVQVDDILEALVWRTYSPKGQGGFFPLIDSEEDQTKVEIWYQMNAYILELPNH